MSLLSASWELESLRAGESERGEFGHWPLEPPAERKGRPMWAPFAYWCAERPEVIPRPPMGADRAGGQTKRNPAAAPQSMRAKAHGKQLIVSNFLPAAVRLNQRQVGPPTH